MTRAPQQRRLATRCRLKAAAMDIVQASSYDAMRVEEVVLKAGLAKGTFFSHFGDKDALMAELIGADLAAAMDRMRTAPPPQTTDEITDALLPLADVMGSERIVFDVVLRYSGATTIQDVGPIGQNFIDQIGLFIGWISPLQGISLRDDVPAPLLAEGIQAFLVQAIALKFCAVESTISLPDRLAPYLRAWLTITSAE